MRKQLLVAAGLLVLGVGAQAQDTPVLPAVPVPPPDPTLGRPAPDTVQAVHALFRKRRNGGTVYTSLGGLVLLRGVLSGPYAAGLGVSAAVSAPFLAIGISKLVRFGTKREDVVIKQYQKGQPLPAAIRRRLRAEHFEPVR
ncbi:hypothetical protein GCM10027048_23560 [Hymenobacter coalescens]